MPYAFASPEWSNEKGLDAALAFLLLGISSYHCVEAPIYGSKNVIEFLKDGTQELLGATMVVNTNPKDLAKKIVVDMVNKRKKLGWCIPDSISDSLNIIKNESKSNKVHFTMVK
jgi:anaerobic carbon-monoxide dehydrogenase catalytic subunit